MATTDHMTRVDFYILADAAPRSRSLFACRLTDKAYRMQHPVYIHTESEEQATHMDDLLWTFSQGSFLPHSLAQQITADDIPPIVIGHNHELPTTVQPDTAVLINIASTVPLFFSHFQRVAEIIDQSPAQKQIGRERYRFYRDRGYDLQSHNITSAES
jgi:DNA polymerase III subunit chi